MWPCKWGQVKEALARHGKPGIFNTDQGSQFTSIAFTQVLKDAEIAISMPLGDSMQSPGGNRRPRSMERQRLRGKAVANNQI